MSLLTKFSRGIAIALFSLSSESSAQQVIACYTVGLATNSTPYVSVQIEGEKSESIEINEYTLAIFDEITSKTVTFNRRGIGSITRIATDENSIFKVVIDDFNWEVIPILPDEVPHAILEEMNEKRSVMKSSKITDSLGSVLISKGIPARDCTILVLDVDDLNAPCIAISQVIRGGLFNRFELLERNDLAGLLEEQKLSMTGLVSEEVTLSAGRIVGAQYASRISCTGLDGQYLITLEFIDCETSSIEGILTVSSPNITGAAQLILSELNVN